MNQTIEKPKYCDLILLENCMLRCRMCRMWQCTRDSDLVPAQYYREFIISLYDYVGKDMQIQFVGGEPLLKAGIIDLVSTAADKGFVTTLTSNGYLIDRAVAQELRDAGCSSLTISLDSLDPAVHDALRGVPGVHERAMKALRYLTQNPRPGQSISVVTTIMKDTVEGLEALVEWVGANPGIACISFQAVVQPFYTDKDALWYTKPAYAGLWPEDISRVHTVLDALIKRKKNGAKIGNAPSQFEQFKRYFAEPNRSAKQGTCHLGYASLSVNSSGDVYLCFDQPPIGNIMRNTMYQMWESPLAEHVRSRIKTCSQNCKSRMNCFSEEGFSI